MRGRAAARWLKDTLAVRPDLRRVSVPRKCAWGWMLSLDLDDTPILLEVSPDPAAPEDGRRFTLDIRLERQGFGASRTERGQAWIKAVQTVHDVLRSDQAVDELRWYRRADYEAAPELAPGLGQP
jgi:hypothetical protein